MDSSKHSLDDDIELAESSICGEITPALCDKLSQELQTFHQEYKTLYTRYNPASIIHYRPIYNRSALGTSGPIQELLMRLINLSGILTLFPCNYYP
jgi:hypothetical protein